MCEGISQAAVAIDALQGLHTLLASRTPPAQLYVTHLYGLTAATPWARAHSSRTA